MHVFLDEQLVGFPVSTLSELEGMVDELSFEPIIELISILAARVVGADRTLEAQEELAQLVFAESPMLKRVQGALRQHPGAHVFAEQNIYALMQLLIDRAKPRVLGEQPDPFEPMIFNRSLFASTAILDSGQEDLRSEFSQEDDWLPYLIQLSSYYSQPNLMEEMTRFELMLNLARSPAARECNSYCPIDEWFEEVLGLSALEQVRLMMAFAARCDAFDGKKTKTRISAEAVDGLLQTADLADKRDQALSLISATREEFARSLAELGEGPRRLLWELRPFKLRPFLKCEEGDLILLSPRFVESWFAEGLHYRALSIAQEKNLAPRYLAFAGWLYEAHCVELTKKAHSGLLGVKVHGDRPYKVGKAGKTCDVTVDHVTDLVLVEATNSRFKASTLTKGDRGDALEDLERVLLKKCRQLGSCISRVLAGEAPFPEDLEKVKNIWPIVVSAGVPMQTPPLWNYLLPKLPAVFQQPRVQPLTLLDPEEFEVLCALVEGGHPLPELLARKTAETYRFLDLKAWLSDDPQAPKVRRRVSLIEDAFSAATNRIASEMKFASEQDAA